MDVRTALLLVVFSSVAEPAGPVDPEAAKRAAEKYHFHCVTMPKLVAFFDKTEIVTPEECTAQANTGAPLAAGPTTSVVSKDWAVSPVPVKRHRCSLNLNGCSPIKVYVEGLV